MHLKIALKFFIFQGDSGGPVVLKKDGNEYLFGIITGGSLGKFCADGRPAFFTNVSFFSDWITNVMSQRHCRLSPDPYNNYS